MQRTIVQIYHIKRPRSNLLLFILPLHAFVTELHKPFIRSKSIIKIPSQNGSPYNAQATLHFEDAFWGLYLPVTVAGRVSDILRSYVMQSLFKRL